MINEIKKNAVFKYIVKVLKMLNILFFIGLVIIIILYLLAPKISLLLQEQLYNKRPSIESLVALSIPIMENEDYQRMIKYYPLLPDYEKFKWIVRSDDLYLPDSVTGRTMPVEDAYAQMKMYQLMAYCLSDDIKLLNEVPRIIIDFSKEYTIDEGMNAIVRDKHLNKAQLLSIIEAIDSYDIDVTNVVSLSEEEKRFHFLLSEIEIKLYYKAHDDQQAKQLETELSNFIKALSKAKNK